MAGREIKKDIQTTGFSGCSLAAETMHVMGDFRMQWLCFAFCFALVLSGCRETEEVSSPEGRVAIGFSPATTSPLARAATMDGDGLRAGGFRVSAFMTGAEGWNGAASGITPGFMYNQLVEWEEEGESDGYWSYTPVKYWPGKVNNTEYGKVSFFAWAPAVVGTPSASTATGAPTLSVTVPDANAGQFDLTADALPDRTQNNGAINFAFSHLLSRIGFSGKLDAPYPDATVTVTSLKIKYASGKVKNGGVYTFGSTDHASGSWALTEASSSSMTTPGGGAGDQVAPDAGFPALSTAGTAVNDPARYLMLLPQIVAEGDLQAEVTWMVVSGAGANQSAVTNSATVSFPAMEWEQGHVYTYRLSVSLDAVQIDGVTVEAWGATVSYDQIDITYEANDGSGKKVVKHTFPNTLVSENIFTPLPEKVFLSWNTQSDGGGASYTPGQAVTFSGNITLYAQWGDAP
jgi:hypothetical protein